jgi:hypothetical protein
MTPPGVDKFIIILGASQHFQWWRIKWLPELTTLSSTLQANCFHLDGKFIMAA